AMSDLVVVMNKGRIEQMGAPAEVYEQPRSEFVASFLGNANFLPANVQQVTDEGIIVEMAGGERLLVGDAARPVAAGEPVRVVVRAEKIVIADAQAAGLQARVVDVDYLGSMARYQMELRGGERMLSLVSLKDRALDLGEAVALQIEPRHCRIL
ncbi:MAG TPA: TOBE domain-containing protein, partial [Dongiaceae bacterium]|nr:TOBE domain-containing protein [Dongiaceae bacterium]